MYRKIVVGYDGGDPGRDALALARTLRAADGVVVAACVYPATGRARGEQLETVLADTAAETLADARAQVDGDWLELQPVPGDSPAHGLHVFSERVEADLVVVGSSHRGHHGHVLAGSTGERLLNGSPCPVAVPPTGFAAGADTPRVIGVAYDGSEGAVAALREATGLAAEFEATLRLITAIPPLEMGWSAAAFYGHPGGGGTIEEDRHEAFRRVLDEAADAVPAEARAATVLVEGRPSTVIADEAGKGIHLLVMGSRNYGPIRRVMVGSTAIELMRLSPCPVIVIPRDASTPSADTSDAAAAAAA